LRLYLCIHLRRPLEHPLKGSQRHQYALADFDGWDLAATSGLISLVAANAQSLRRLRDGERLAFDVLLQWCHNAAGCIVKQTALWVTQIVDKGVTLVKKPDIKRYPLNMRTTKSLRLRLERAATKSGRSLAQEVERRLERSLDFENHLVMAQGDVWCPVLVNRKDAELWIGLGDDPRDFPVQDGDSPHQETLIVLKLEPRDLKRLVNCFGGATWPYDYTDKELDDLGSDYLEMQREIRRGK
jgi:hypothetical protein